jgi:ElaB/YqjD/DUF883 family membrane-anchored ribosome-binding protein
LTLFWLQNKEKGVHMGREVTREKLVSDFKVVIGDAEELLKATAGQVGERAGEARERFEKTVKNWKKNIIEAEEIVIDKTKEAAKATDSYVRDNPWKAVGVAAAVGFLAGLVINRKS